MNAQSWGTLIFSVALIVVGGYFANKYRFKSPLPYLSIILGCVAVMLSFYMNADRINYEDYGTPAEFGQLGDYFGGILNPTFGFITIMILLYTLKLELNRSIKDNAQRNRIELYEYLQKLISSFDQDLTKKHFFNQQSYLDRYTENGKFKTDKIDEVQFLMKKVKEVIDENSDFSPGDPEILIKSFGRLRIKVRTIIWGYIELITVHEIPLIKLGLAYDVLNWAQYLQEIGLSTKGELAAITKMVNSAHTKSSSMINNKPSTSPPQYE